VALGRDGGALAGHLSKAHVRPTLEIVLVESPVHLQKVQNPESGRAYQSIMKRIAQASGGKRVRRYSTRYRSGSVYDKR
jgi:hypothetical protein